MYIVVQPGNVTARARRGAARGATERGCAYRPRIASLVARRAAAGIASYLDVIASTNCMRISNITHINPIKYQKAALAASLH